MFLKQRFLSISSKILYCQKFSQKQIFTFVRKKTQICKNKSPEKKIFGFSRENKFFLKYIFFLTLKINFPFLQALLTLNATNSLKFPYFNFPAICENRKLMLFAKKRKFGNTSANKVYYFTLGR